MEWWTVGMLEEGRGYRGQDKKAPVRRRAERGLKGKGLVRCREGRRWLQVGFTVIRGEVAACRQTLPKPACGREFLRPGRLDSEGGVQ